MSLISKEEKQMNENTSKAVENAEPDWSIGMFWEDITYILKKIGELIEEFIRAFSGDAE